ncbi:MAG: L,D-transpeptidase, partial [Bradyrhizobium sp.]|nr:L,D-transpeptidase [Bradyrhizobium sp.]
MTKFSAVRRSFSPRAVTAFAFATVLLAVPFGGASAQTVGYAPMRPPASPPDQLYSQGSYVNEAPQA